MREDFRLFKLKRLEELRVNGRSFEKQVVPPPDLSNEAVFPALIQVKAILHGDCKWKLVEEFGVDCFDELEDGKLLFHGAYANKEHLIGWLLSFGDRVRLLEPEELRAELRTIVENMWKCQSVDGHI